MKSIFFYKTAIGSIGIAETNNSITNVDFVDINDIVNDMNAKNINSVQTKDIEINETPLLEEAGKQLQQYLEGNRKYFDLPLLPTGTEFQKNVWRALPIIPYGATWSYKQVAKK